MFLGTSSRAPSARCTRSAPSPARSSGPAGNSPASLVGVAICGAPCGRPGPSKSCAKISSRPLSMIASNAVASARSRRAWAATAAKLAIPSAGLPVASASPRAAAIPTRSPVKRPGPTVTAIASRAANASPASAMTSRSIGSSRSPWPCSIGAKRCAASSPFASSAAEQAPPAQSKARIFGVADGLRRRSVMARWQCRSWSDAGAILSDRRARSGTNFAAPRGPWPRIERAG